MINAKDAVSLTVEGLKKQKDTESFKARASFDAMVAEGQGEIDGFFCDLVRELESCIRLACASGQMCTVVPVLDMKHSVFIPSDRLNASWDAMCRVLPAIDRSWNGEKVSRVVEQICYKKIVGLFKDQGFDADLEVQHHGYYVRQNFRIGWLPEQPAEKPVRRYLGIFTR